MITKMTNPGERASMKGYTGKISDSSWINRAWIRLEIDQQRDFCFDDVIHLFFDDTCYAESPEDHLGESLFDGEEVAAVRRIVVAIDTLLDAQEDRYVTDAEYVQMPEWGEVHEAAKALHTLIVANDAKMAASPE